MNKKASRTKKTVKFDDLLYERLRKPKAAAAYLNAALEDEDPQVFLLAIRHVAEANGGLSKLAKESELNRESLYRTLSSRGNPRLDSLLAILETFNLHLAIRPYPS